MLPPSPPCAQTRQTRTSGSSPALRGLVAPHALCQQALRRLCASCMQGLLTQEAGPHDFLGIEVVEDSGQGSSRKTWAEPG